MQRKLKTILRYATIFATLALVQRGCNMAWNNQTINAPGYFSQSRATGILGHEEFTLYSDGSQEVKVYPGFGHRMFGSILYQDLDGDDQVDRIRMNGPEWKMNRLTELLVRESDYDHYQSEFDRADQRLEEVTVRFSH